MLESWRTCAKCWLAALDCTLVAAAARSVSTNLPALLFQPCWTCNSETSHTLKTGGKICLSYQLLGAVCPLEEGLLYCSNISWRLDKYSIWFRMQSYNENISFYCHILYKIYILKFWLYYRLYEICTRMKYWPHLNINVYPTKSKYMQHLRRL